MEYNAEKKEIKVDRELGHLERFVLDFTKILEKYCDYVIISGYVSILLGRSRATEDVDLFISEIDSSKFNLFFNEISSIFECINTSNSQEGFSLLKEKIALRFSYPKIPIPNIELKFVKNDLDKFSLSNRLKIILPGEKVYISPLEIQIAFKLFLGSDKDFEDAKHLYSVFNSDLNINQLLFFIKKLHVEKEFENIK